MISKRENLPTANAGMSYPRDEDWRDQASCLGLDVDDFYPEGQGHHVPDAVKRTCQACPVRRACLDFALTHRDKWGIYGGVSERDRRGRKPGDDIPIRLKNRTAP